MNIQRKNSAHHFRMQSEREQTLINVLLLFLYEEGLYKVDKFAKFSRFLALCNGCNS